MMQVPKLPHFMATSDLDPAHARFLLDASKKMDPFVRKGETIPILQGKTVVNLFFENSTRTRTSFEQATRRLGAATLNFASARKTYPPPICARCRRRWRIFRRAFKIRRKPPRRARSASGSCERSLSSSGRPALLLLRSKG